MAGIIAGHGHGAGDADGVIGIAPEAKILPVRVILEDGDPARAKARNTRGNALADGIRWAADHGADVINLSLGDDSASAHPEPARGRRRPVRPEEGRRRRRLGGQRRREGRPHLLPGRLPGRDRRDRRRPLRHPRLLLHPPLVRHGQRPRRRRRHRRPRPQVLRGLGDQRRLRVRLRRRRPHQGRPPGPDARPRSRSSWRTRPATPPPAAATTPAASASSTPPPPSSRGRRLKPRGPAGRRLRRRSTSAPAPTPPSPRTTPPSWAAPLAGGLGGVLLVAAVFLWRGRRGRPDDFYEPAPAATGTIAL